MQVNETGLSDFLIGSGLITRGQLTDLLNQAEGESLYEILQRRNVIAEDELRRAAAHASGTKFILLAREDIAPEALILIPEPFARSRNVIAYRLEKNILEVALLDLDIFPEIEKLNLAYKIVPRLTSRNSIKTGLIYYQKLLKEKFGSLLQQGAHVVDALVIHALHSGAHGIHIDHLSTATTLVRYRIGAALHEAMQLPEQVGATLTLRLKSLAKLLPTSSTIQEGRFKFEKDNETHNVHVTALPTVGGERLVLRLTKETPGQTGFALTSLGFHGPTLEETHALLGNSSGLIVVAGPRGSGKTTTLYTMLDQLLSRHLSIATIESEIEHRFPHIAQTVIKPELGLTTAAGLRAILRQDPDVVMVGDITDSDTAALAANAASRGVLVLAGISTQATPTPSRVGVPTASVGIEKLRELGVSPLVLAATLRGAIGVCTVKKLCSHDKEEYRLARAEAAPLEARIDFGRVLASLKAENIVEGGKQWKELLFSHAISCSHCEEGYQGVTGLQEVLPITATIKEMIREGATREDIEAMGRQEGMQSILEDGLFKAVQGMTSIEEVFRLAEL